MEKTVSATDASRKFSRLPRGVREGHSYVLTIHGRLVARLVSAGTHNSIAASAGSTLLSRLERQPVTNVGRWTRDELYEDDR